MEIESVIRLMISSYKDISIYDLTQLRDRLKRFCESITEASYEEIYMVVLDNEGLNVIKYITHLDFRSYRDIEIAICAKGKSIKKALQSVIQSLDETLSLNKTATKNF